MFTEQPPVGGKGPPQGVILDSFSGPVLDGANHRVEIGDFVVQFEIALPFIVAFSLPASVALRSAPAGAVESLPAGSCFSSAPTCQLPSAHVGFAPL